MYYTYIVMHQLISQTLEISLSTTFGYVHMTGN